MARFRRGPANNWEGRPWRTSPALNALMDEIEAAYPARHAVDGTVAGKSHDKNSPSSDHRPYPHKGAGVVNAVDVGETVENQGIQLAEALRRSKDRRIRYVIHEGHIFSSYSSGGTPAWTWRKYTGPNPHSNHVHVSIDRAHANDGRPWNLGLGGTIPTPTPTPPKPPAPPSKGYLVNVNRDTIKQGSKGPLVAIAQSLLAQKGYPPANSFNSAHKPDGVAGSGFDAAVKAFQKAKGLTADGVVGPKTWAVLEAA